MANNEFDDKYNEVATPAKDPWQQPHEVLASISADKERFATGFPPLDSRIRGGGVPTGRIVTIGGPPSAGKTTIVCDIALNMAQKMPVFALFADEGRSQAVIRMAVMLGIGVDKAEEGGEEVSKAMLERMGERGIYCAKPDTVTSTAEEVFAYVASKVAGLPALVILDSTQTIPPSRAVIGEDLRTRIIRFMGMTRIAAEKYKLIVLLTSQSNRASYRMKRTADNSHDMASFAESASIEFLSDVALVLGLPDQETEIVRANLVKNRLRLLSGGKIINTFRIRYDEQSGKMLEVDQATLDVIEAERQLAAARKIGDPVLEELTKNKDGLTVTSLMEMLDYSRGAVIAALRLLEAEKKVFKEQVKHGRGRPYVAWKREWTEGAS